MKKIYLFLLLMTVGSNFGMEEPRKEKEKEREEIERPEETIIIEETERPGEAIEQEFFEERIIPGLPNEVALLTFREGLREIMEQNDIYHPFKGVVDYIRSIVSINPRFEGIGKYLEQQMEELAKEIFAPNASKLSKRELNHKMKINLEFLLGEHKQIFQNYFGITNTPTSIANALEEISQNIARLIIAGVDPDFTISIKDESGEILVYPLIDIIAQIPLNDNLLKLLIDYGAKVEARDYKGDTPLLIASYYSRLPFVKLLIENGADVNAKDNAGFTALMEAGGSLISANLELVKYLLQNGANPDAVDTRGKETIEYFNMNARWWSYWQEIEELFRTYREKRNK